MTATMMIIITRSVPPITTRMSLRMMQCVPYTRRRMVVYLPFRTAKR